MTDTSVRRTAPLPNTEVDTPIGSDSWASVTKAPAESNRQHATPLLSGEK
jgi:hypothetical protein